MKILLLCSFVFLTRFGFSQLLRKDIYDFAVGDAYCVRHYWHQSGGSGFITHRYDLFRITGKTYNPDSSVVNYTASTQTYIPPLPGDPDDTLYFGTTSFSHDDLLSNYSYTSPGAPFGLSLTVFMLTEPDPDSCLVVDTIYDGFNCNGIELQEYAFGMEPTEFPPCFEPLISDYFVREKCGGPYGHWGHPGDPSSSYGGLGLDYFEIDGESCGQFPDFFVGLEEQAAPELNIAPNPSSGRIAVSSNQPLSGLELLTVNGQLIESYVPQGSSVLEIDLGNLPSGLYLIRMQSDRGMVCRKVQKI